LLVIDDVVDVEASRAAVEGVAPIEKKGRVKK
jgi:hypothetical protein